MDSHNQTLISHVHPPDWINPTPRDRYHLVVLGAGTAGLVTAAAAAGLGAKVALVEKFLMGGDCLNSGCVPSKSVIRPSKVIGEIRHAADFGVSVEQDPKVDFPLVMERVRRLRAQISGHDSAKRFQGLGVDVFLGEGRFSDERTLHVNGAALHFKKAVIATGSRALRPPIPGLQEAGFLTNETVFSLTERPSRLAVLGGGPIGCELAQALHRLGSRVTIIEMMPRLLPRDEPEAAETLARRLEGEGIHLRLATKLKMAKSQATSKILILEKNGREEQMEADAILVGVGRVANVDGLNLEAAGVRYNRAGIEVNDFFQTSNPRIYAAGDVCMSWKFTHAADAAARMVVQNALFMGRKKQSSLVMPWCTYTDPEIAHVGLTQEEAREKGIQTHTFFRSFEDVHRAIIDGEEPGFIKILIRKSTDEILGGTIVARHAGEMISELTLAMTAGIGLKKLSQVIHPYPTQSEAIRQVADAYNRTRLTPFVKKLFSLWLRL